MILVCTHKVIIFTLDGIMQIVGTIYIWGVILVICEVERTRYIKNHNRNRMDYIILNHIDYSVLVYLAIHLNALQSTLTVSCILYNILKRKATWCSLIAMKLSFESMNQIKIRTNHKSLIIQNNSEDIFRRRRTLRLKRERK